MTAHYAGPTTALHLHSMCTHMQPKMMRHLGVLSLATLLAATAGLGPREFAPAATVRSTPYTTAAVLQCKCMCEGCKPPQLATQLSWWLLNTLEACEGALCCTAASHARCHPYLAAQVSVLAV